jgi:hypothetical protein
MSFINTILLGALSGLSFGILHAIITDNQIKARNKLIKKRQDDYLQKKGITR